MRRQSGEHGGAPADPTAGPRARLRRGVARAALAGGVALLLGSVGSGVAWAWWTMSTSVSATVSVGTIAPVTAPTCTNDSRLLYDDRVVVGWTPPAGAVPAGGTRHYVVTLTAATGPVVTIPVPNGTNSVSIGWQDIDSNPSGTWAAKRTIRVYSSVNFGSTTWTSAEATPLRASTGSTTTFFGTTYRNLACATP
ncbi:hypothetical protein [Cellulomonas sp.]|uniref:hypothetical protein n=1 Tax=Cellulomonas sp. TaxID=40001 RepID=UPI003BAD3648